jgi:Spy/CpxP family protein refolding chaperone
MQRGITILGIGLAGALLTYACFYYVGSTAHRELLRDQTPELAWLKREFKLGDAEFAQVARLHDAYLSQCQAMCRRIDEQDQRLRQLLAAAPAVTPEIESAIAETARLRAECHGQMLRHFFAMSRAMPPEQGRRFLVWITERTLLRSERGMGPMGHDGHP